MALFRAFCRALLGAQEQQTILAHFLLVVLLLLHVLVNPCNFVAAFLDLGVASLVLRAF